MMQIVERGRRGRVVTNGPPRLAIGDPMVTGMGGTYTVTQIYRRPFIEYVLYRTSGKDRSGRFYLFSHRGLRFVP